MTSEPKLKQPAAFKKTSKQELEMKVNSGVPGVPSTGKLKQYDLIRLISRSSGIKQYIVEDVIHHLKFATLSALLDGKAVVICELFKIYVTESKPRKARNPMTGEEFIAAPRLQVKTKPSLAIKKIINNMKDYT